MEPVRKDTTEGRGGSFSVDNVLSGSGASGFTLWVRDLGVVDSYGQNSGEFLCGFTLSGGGKDGKTTVGWDLEEGSIVEFPQRSGD